VIVVRSVNKTMVGVVTACVTLLCLIVVAGAGAAVPWWQLDSISAPGNLPPGGNGTLIVRASNLGEAEVDASSARVVLKDRLPAGLVATSASGKTGGIAGFHGELGPVQCTIVSGALVECVYEGHLPSYNQVEAEILVKVAASAKTGETNEVSIAGGGATSASLKRPLIVSSAPTPYGVANYELGAFNEDGSLDTQAGSHPFELTTIMDLNRTGPEPFQPALPKDLNFNLPPGLVGNPHPFSQCSDAQFAQAVEFADACPANTALGVATITIYEPKYLHLITVTSPVFNLKPAVGEPAKFGFKTLIADVVLDTSVRTGGDYGVTVSVNNISEIASLLSSEVTIWGVPGDPVHDPSRGWECIDGDIWSRITYGIAPCNPAKQYGAPPFLSLPTSCTGTLRTTVTAESWSQEGVLTSPLAPPSEQALDGCNHLPFEPSINVAPDGQAGSSPSGLNVGIHVPQDLILSPTGLAESNVKDTTVALPAGVGLNPAAADGLEACSETQIALSNDVVPVCPEASKVATVEIKTPLLPDALVGEAYLAAQNANPFGSLVALYIVAQDPVSGTLVKVAGEVKPDPITGQLVSTFDNTPQLPFEDLNLHFFGGSRAPLSTPALCGSYTTRASIAPWSGNPPAEPSSTFNITSGPNGSPCANPLPFSPSLTAGTTSIQAGGFSPFTMTMSRPDGSQNLQAIQLKMPPGLLGTLATVKLCKEAQANAGTCGPESLIGHTVVSVGVGGNPYSVTGGQVFITEGYGGAPYGLSIVNPAKAGPFDLGQVVVRARIEVDPISTVLTITTDTTGPYKIPTILDGIPLQIQHVNVSIDRPGFTFNPTNCSPLAITGSLTSDQGATQALSVPFQITNCAVLAFKPKLVAKTNGKTSRSQGASLSVKLTYPAGPYDANIARVKVDLPKQLPSRLTTLQQACSAATFNANPAACPPASIVGHATASTPVMPVPLTGPAYFVSHGGEQFPDLIIVLQGYGATVHLIGSTFINEKTGVTSSTFKTIPDVPVGTFELTLPQGKYSALAANGNLCTTKKLTMPTLFVAQNGATIHTSTPIVPTGCSKHVKAKKAKHKSKAKRGRK
jgi:hypothetical protein